MNKQERNIEKYAIIPTSILYNKDLKANEKLLFAIISSLSNKEGYCFASNKYLAQKLNVNHKTISSWISDLKDKKLIIVELVRTENKQIIQRKIYINHISYPLNNNFRKVFYYIKSKIRLLN